MGLVLAGGRSRRMGQDKTQLTILGQSLLMRTYELAVQVCSETYISLRQGQDQPREPGIQSGTIIDDQYGEIGPLGGILSAFDKQPGGPWLVLAVDLPCLDKNTLDFLLAHRNPEKPFTAYRGSSDGLPEPLCAIYEPQSKGILWDYFKNRRDHSPRSILIKENPHLLNLPKAKALANINTLGDYQNILAQLTVENEPK